MAGTRATSALRAAGVAFTEHGYPHDARAESYGSEAAEALGVEPERVLKTLIVAADRELVVAIVPVTNRLDLKALAAAVGARRAELADAALAERRTGYVVGGISPIGQRTRLRTVVDESADRWGTVFVSGGRRGLDLELSPADLVRLTDATLAAIGR